ncbi:uncharacterized protein wu:fi75a02 isoform X2 [Oryzias melastigma]|uniref:uncharacterized protein wu:fi75a02 isoform X2 n=1 Tax=Oryzias melastigma TaxID=30732 RepID=UPI000CF82CD9|nr:uncharacterized protein wu:fi75a02 isoform X2 [Oryzias melastigma]
MLSRPSTPTDPASPPVSLTDMMETHTGDCSPRPPPPPAPPCSCSSLLTRLLAAHRLEVRRLLRGALASIGHRLEVLERRTRRRRRRTPNRGARPSGSPVSASSSTLFTSDTPASFTRSDFSLLTSLSSTGSEETPSSAESNQPEQRRKRMSAMENVNGVKRRKVLQQDVLLSRDGEHSSPKEEEEEEEEEEAGRCISQITDSLGTGAFTVHRFSVNLGGVSQSQPRIVLKRNGYRFFSHDALRAVQSLPNGRAGNMAAVVLHSGCAPHASTFPGEVSCTATSHLHRPPILHLSAVAIETLLDRWRGGASWGSLWPLKDWTAPPSLGSDHCYTLETTTSIGAQLHLKRRAGCDGALNLLQRGQKALPPPVCSANGLLSSRSVQSAGGSFFLSSKAEFSKRVSQIRIRRSSPREAELTPMGLPKVKRIKKKEFSVEEIYTNKNYRPPPTNSLETIFEEPREKNGALLLIGQQKRRRLLLFPDVTQPRKRKKPPGAGLLVATVPRKRAAARRHIHGMDDDSDLDVMLVERLSALEDFLTRQGLDE